MHPLIAEYLAAEAIRVMMADARKARMARQARQHGHGVG